MQFISAPTPTMKEVVWALYRAMTNTRMSLGRLWLCKYDGQWRFWAQVERYLNWNLYGIDHIGLSDGAYIGREWVRRFIINNWEDIAPQLQTMFEFGPANLVFKKDVPPPEAQPGKQEDQTEPSLQVVNNEAA